jgi:hypothetical protein
MSCRPILANPWFYCTYDLGQSDIKGLVSRLEIMGPEKRLEQPVGVTLGANCYKSYGDLDCGIPTRANVWAATTAYVVEDLVKRLTGSGIFWFKATVAGTSAGTEPTWPTVLGNTVVDGTVTWKAIRARRLIGTVTLRPIAAPSSPPGSPSPPIISARASSPSRPATMPATKAGALRQRHRHADPASRRL